MPELANGVLVWEVEGSSSSSSNGGSGIDPLSISSPDAASVNARFGSKFSTG